MNYYNTNKKFKKKHVYSNNRCKNKMKMNFTLKSKYADDTHLKKLILPLVNFIKHPIQLTQIETSSILWW